ncbi:hypothetical protein QWY77_10820 [Thalassotalea ponticola]|uniref:hypothetical protein n=1 Tax=Thalassotalea ponticola TaxID=1523392 RepID=UPI0025B629A1|nr:hypothetical protein [Thalassotalea ponticola]MDN3653235.1 hypothetical protein [Thalassotalea ponticola]
MKKIILLISVLLNPISLSVAAPKLSHDSINHIAQQFIEYHRTENPDLLKNVMAKNVQVTVSQGSNGYGMVLQYSRQEYVDYLQQGHRSKVRVGTDVALLSSELIGSSSAKIVIRYRSKTLNKYVWMEGIIDVVNGAPKITSIDEYT